MSQLVNEEERIRKLIEERKALKVEEEEKLSVQKEKERREQGKSYQQTLKQIEQMAEQKEREQSEKEKTAERIYQQQLREQVQKEREERQRIESQSSNPVPPPVNTETKRTESDSDLALFRVRLLNGDSIVESFTAKITLGEVMNILNLKYKITEKYSFRMTFPNKVFTKEDESKSLLDLNLVPNATLVMTQSEVTPRGPHLSTQQTSQDTQGQSYIQQTWDYLSSWVYWFLGTGPQQQQQQQQSTPSRSSGPTSRGRVNEIRSEIEYNSLKNTNDLVIVDVSTTWCGPCKKIAPLFEELARVNPSVVFIHVDLDQFKHVIGELANIRSVPTFLFFKNKKLVTQFSGANQQQLKQNLDRYK